MSSWHKFRCPDSRGTAAEDCRREGCIRHRLTWAHQDRPKPRATRARLPERLGVQGQLTGKNAPTGVIRDIVGGPYHPPLWRCHSREAKQAIFARGARYIYVGYSRWALASTIVAFSQHGPARKHHLLRLLLRTLLSVFAWCVFSWAAFVEGLLRLLLLQLECFAGGGAAPSPRAPHPLFEPPSFAALSQHGRKAGRDMTGEFMAQVPMPRQPWNSGRGLPPRGVYPTPSHMGAPGPPETTCHQGQVAREVGRSGTAHREKRAHRSYQGHRRWALSSTFVALSQQGSKAGNL